MSFTQITVKVVGTSVPEMVTGAKVFSPGGISTSTGLGSSLVKTGGKTPGSAYVDAVIVTGKLISFSPHHF